MGERVSVGESECRRVSVYGRECVWERVGERVWERGSAFPSLFK